MPSGAPGNPSRETGLPPGVEVAPLAPRFVAYLIDASVPLIAGVVAGAVLPTLDGGRVPLSIVVSVVTLAWALLLLFRLANKAATPGLQAMKLQLVGFYDGRPVGLGRALLRGLVMWLLSVTGVGLLVLIILLLLHPRHQGLHDQAAKAVLIKRRALAPRSAQSGAASMSPPQQLPGGQPPQYQPQQYRTARPTAAVREPAPAPAERPVPAAAPAVGPGSAGTRVRTAPTRVRADEQPGPGSLRSADPTGPAPDRRLGRAAHAADPAARDEPGGIVSAGGPQPARSAAPDGTDVRPRTPRGTGDGPPRRSDVPLRVAGGAR